MCRRTNRKKTRTFRVSDITVRNGVTAQPPGRHRTGRAISVHGLAAGLWQRRFCAMRGRVAFRPSLNAGASSTVSEVRPSSPSGAEATGVTTLLSYLASESEGSLKVQGWSASGGRAEVVSDAEGTGGKAVKLTKEAGKSSWVLEYAAGNGAALLQKGGQMALPL
uniref:Uncharacterized protein n=1 Tax=Escherichia phage 933W TaxID=10730 RepID=Q9ZWW7_BP933|nr:hypothetical protein [Escherichia phage 933W]